MIYNVVLVSDEQQSVCVTHIHISAFLDDSVVKTPPSMQETVSIPGSGRSPGEGSGNPLQNSCLGNPMDRGAWQATVPRVATIDTT